MVCKPSELTSVTAWVLMHAFEEAGTYLIFVIYDSLLTLVDLTRKGSGEGGAFDHILQIRNC